MIVVHPVKHIPNYTYKESDKSFLIYLQVVSKSDGKGCGVALNPQN